MELDLGIAAYSGFGSYFTIVRGRKEDGTNGVFLRTMHGDADPRNVFEIVVLKEGNPAAFREKATHATVTLEAEGGGKVELCIDEPNVVRVRATGAGVRLDRRKPNDRGYNADYPFEVVRGRIQVNAFRSRKQYMISVFAGDYRIEAPWEQVTCPLIQLDFFPDENGNTAEIALDAFDTSWTERAYERPFEACVEAADAAFRRWLAATPPGDAGDPAARELAAYAQYACVVEPHGMLERRTMLISPGFNGVWSWDHAFNAMALAYMQPAMAWDQLLVPFDRQDETGAIPDYYNDRSIVWNYTKPPVHGWALARMLERTNGITADMLATFYPKLVRWTDWWFERRDYDGNGFPQYNHGNDSGWDNAMVFKEPGPVEGPDLAAFLVVQMDALALVAHRIGKPDEAAAWRRRADDLFARLMDYFWDGDMFVAKRSGTGETIKTDSLLHWIPVILGGRLPPDVIRKAAEALRPDGPFVTAWGPATEKPSSAYYEADGYWRGPVWAPSTLILIDGLYAAGEREIAREIARRFCRLCAEGGMSENFDALTGAGLRDRFHSWPASVFLIVAQEYVS